MYLVITGTCVYRANISHHAVSLSVMQSQVGMLFKYQMVNVKIIDEMPSSILGILNNWIKIALKRLTHLKLGQCHTLSPFVKSYWVFAILQHPSEIWSKQYQCEDKSLSHYRFVFILRVLFALETPFFKSLKLYQVLKRVIELRIYWR